MMYSGDIDHSREGGAVVWSRGVGQYQCMSQIDSAWFWGVGRLVYALCFDKDMIKYSTCFHNNLVLF